MLFHFASHNGLLTFCHLCCRIFAMKKDSKPEVITRTISPVRKRGRVPVMNLYICRNILWLLIGKKKKKIKVHCSEISWRVIKCDLFCVCSKCAVLNIPTRSDSKEIQCAIKLYQLRLSCLQRLQLGRQRPTTTLDMYIVSWEMKENYKWNTTPFICRNIDVGPSECSIFSTKCWEGRDARVTSAVSYSEIPERWGKEEINDCLIYPKTI